MGFISSDRINAEDDYVPHIYECGYLDDAKCEAHFENWDGYLVWRWYCSGFSINNCIEPIC